MSPSQNNTHHSDFSKIPVIDISGLYSSTLTARQKVAEQIFTAASEVGFFYIAGHAVSAARRADLIHAAKAFFAQPLADKMHSYIGNSRNHSGYVPEGEERFYSASLDASKVDHKECYDVGFELDDLSLRRPMLGANQWPKQEGFKPAVQNYYQEAFELGQLLFRGFALALGLPEDTLVSQCRCPPSQLRLIHYPYDATAEDREGIGAHTDYECFTLLLPTTDGLQVLNGAGEWIEAPFKADCFVVNIGDMLELISNGRFVATSHRVKKVKQERYSFPLFCSLDYDTTIAPVLPPLGEEAKAYTPLKCGDHLYAQTIQTFQYLQKKLATGEISLPNAAKDIGSFGGYKDTLS